MRRLTPDQWHRVDAVFDAALDQPAEARDRFLTKACDDDSEVYEIVTALLELEGEAETVLGESAATYARPVLAGVGNGADAAEEMPSQVGPYRILSEIGRGGMGRVYLAQRDDRQYTRQVALKLVRRDVTTDELLRRFRREQQILASLEHPSIARLYDAGATEDGRPYLAMEYVVGRPITAYCDARRLSIEARLRLFGDVCRAVQYAHQKLVVHRDLKPSNIVVTDDGEVKLLDFGIAKLLDEQVSEGANPDASGGADPDISEPADPETQTGFHVMTPEYAAPEQIRGMTPSTATDVYSLAVVLYELLTGRRPYDLRRAMPWQAHRIILEEEPKKPSTIVRATPSRADSRVGGDKPGGDKVGREGAPVQEIYEARASTPDRLRRRLRGDLDTILLAALRKDPARRYPTVEAFHDDIERYLSGAPVTARPDTALYRTKKFVGRHRWGVAAVVSIVGLLVAFAIVTTIQLAATSRERDRAESALDKSEQVMTFMTDLFREADPLVAQGDTLNVYQLIERASRRAEAGMIEQPDVYAAVLQTIGTVYLNLAEYDTARTMLSHALAVQRENGSDGVEVAATLEYLGRTYREQGDVARAVALHEEALDLRRRVQGAGHIGVAAGLSELGISLHLNGDFERSEDVFQEAIAIYRGAGGNQAGLADALANLGVLRHDIGNVAEAEPLFREALAIAETQYGTSHPKVAMALSSLASTLQISGNIAAAESLFTRALRIHRNAFGEMNPNVSLVLNNMATLYDELGAHEKADSLYRESMRIDTYLLGANNANIAITRHNFGLMLREMGRLDDAEREIRQAVDVLRSTLSEDHLYTAIISSSLGIVVCENGKLDEGESILRESLETMEVHLPSDHWRIAIGKRNLGGCLVRSGSLEEAAALLPESRARLAEEMGEDSDVTREADRWLEELYEARGVPSPRL